MKRVMILGDEILVRVGLRSFLNWEEHGYTISAEASDGREALEKIEMEPPDIILTAGARDAATNSSGNSV